MAQDSPSEEITGLPRFLCRRNRIIAWTFGLSARISMVTSEARAFETALALMWHQAATVTTLPLRSHFHSTNRKVICLGAAFGGGLLKTDAPRSTPGRVRISPRSFLPL